MPDEIATRAVLLLMLGLMAGLALIPIVGWLWRMATGASEGTGAGTAAGAALWAGCLLYAAVEIGAWVLSLGERTLVEGRLVDYVAETYEIGSGGAVAGPRKSRGQAPRVSFRTPDGREHVIRGLGGSLAGLEPGDPVTLRYDPADPAGAIPADFQNERGALALFGWLGVLAALISVWMGWGAVLGLKRERAETKPGRRRRQAGSPPSRWAAWRDGPGQAWRPALMRAGLLCCALALVLPFVLLELEGVHMLDAFGFAFTGVAAALFAFGLRAALERGAASAYVLFGRLIGVLGFGLFALILWALRG